MKKNFILIFLLLLVSLAGCSGKKSSKDVENLRTGTEGLTMGFVPNAPPDIIHVERGMDSESNSFDVILEVRNKGAYPEIGGGTGREGMSINGKIYLGGYDPNIVIFESFVADLNSKTLEGKNTVNPNGGVDFVTFKGRVTDSLNVERYEPVLLATVCYSYATIASPSVCIDPDPYSTIKGKKVCEAKDITLSNQGAPIAVVKVDEEAFATKTQFRITIKNVGGGEVMKNEVLFQDKCSPFGSSKVEREDIDKVYLINARLSNKELQCGPFAEGEVKSAQGFVRLVNSEGSITCELPKSDYGSNTAYISPLEIKLLYVYRSTAEKKVQVKREASGFGGGGSDIPSSTSYDRPINPQIEFPNQEQ